MELLGYMHGAIGLVIDSYLLGIGIRNPINILVEPRSLYLFVIAKQSLVPINILECTPIRRY